MHTKALRCYDCDQPSASYMVRDSVWNKAFPDYLETKRVLLKTYGRDNPMRFINLCFPCLETRLGRKLSSFDFDLKLPINQGIALRTE